MSGNRVHYWDGYGFADSPSNSFDGMNTSSSPSDEYLTANSQSQGSPSSVRSDNSGRSETSEEIRRQIYTVASALLHDEFKNVNIAQKKTRDVGCQVADPSTDSLFLEEFRKIKHEFDDCKHGMDYFKEKCQQQEVLLAKQNVKLADNEAIVEELTSFFNSKLEQFKIEFEAKAKSLIISGSSQKAQESAAIEQNPDIARIKTELKYYEADNSRLRHEMSQIRCYEVDNAVLKAQMSSKMKERDQKWRFNLFDFFQGQKSKNSVRRKSAL